MEVMAMNKCSACGAFNPASKTLCFKCKAEIGSSGGTAPSPTPPRPKPQIPRPRAASLEDSADGFDGPNPVIPIFNAGPASAAPPKLHLAGKVVDNHTRKFSSPDDMIVKTVCPAGPYTVSECHSYVKNRKFNLNLKQLAYFFIAVIVLSALGGGSGSGRGSNSIGNLIDMGIGLYLLFALGAVALAWIRGIRVIPDAVVLHGNTLSVFHGVLRNKSEETVCYFEAYHIPLKSVKRVWLLSWLQFTFNTDVPPVSVTLTPIRYFLPWTKNKYYFKSIVPLKEMKARVQNPIQK